MQRSRSVYLDDLRIPVIPNGHSKQTYLQEHSWDGDWRIDVVAVEMTPGGKLLRVELIKNAVTDWGLL